MTNAGKTITHRQLFAAVCLEDIRRRATIPSVLRSPVSDEKSKKRY